MIPLDDNLSQKSYRIQDIISYKNGAYYVANSLSQYSIERMSKYLDDQEINHIISKFESEKVEDHG